MSDLTIKTGGEDLSIFEIMQRYRNDGSCEHVIQDALRRVSLLDSQAATARTVAKEFVALSLSPVKGIDHLRNNYWQRAKGAEEVMRRLQGKSTDGVAPTDVATQMRDECVRKVKEMGQQWYGEAKRRGAAFSDKGRIAETIAAELESLTLDHLNQEKRKDAQM